MLDEIARHRLPPAHTLYCAVQGGSQVLHPSHHPLVRPAIGRHGRKQPHAADHDPRRLPARLFARRRRPPLHGAPAAGVFEFFEEEALMLGSFTVDVFALRMCLALESTLLEQWSGPSPVDIEDAIILSGEWGQRQQNGAVKGRFGPDAI